MRRPEVLKTTNEIPDDFALLLRCLGNTLRFRISLLLIDNDKLSFNEISNSIKKEVNLIIDSVIMEHIRKLEMAGIVQNFLEKEENDDECSFYKITEYGKKMVTDVINSYNEYYKKIIM